MFQHEVDGPKKDRRLNAQNRDHAPGQVILEATQFFVEFGTQVSQLFSRRQVFDLFASHFLGLGVA